MIWTIEEAKKNLNELIKKTQTEGAQYISIPNEPPVVVISEKEYKA